MRRTFAGVVAAWPLVLFAHGGGLDANGCHTDRRTGDYHCHRANQPPPQPRNAFADQPRGENQRAASSSSTYYRNCAEARAAGVAPLRAGEPGYGRHLDRDGDGLACEPYRR